MGNMRRWFSALLPSAGGSEAAAARFLDEGALAQPAVALDLIAKEQLDVARGLPQYLDDIREDTRAQATATAGVRHARTVAVLKEVTRHTAALAGRPESVTIAQQVSHLAERTELLVQLGDSIRELADSLRDTLKSGTLGTLTASMAEGLHLVLSSTVDALETPDEFNLKALHHLTADRGELMEGIRRSLLRGEQTLTLEEHQALFTRPDCSSASSCCCGGCRPTSVVRARR